MWSLYFGISSMIIGIIILSFSSFFYFRKLAHRSRGENMKTSEVIRTIMDSPNYYSYSYSAHSSKTGFMCLAISDFLFHEYGIMHTSRIVEKHRLNISDKLGDKITLRGYLLREYGIMPTKEFIQEFWEMFIKELQEKGQ